ncbi:MAG: hypothetical protein AB9835_08660 [Eubacteriales bacterium]
MKMFFWSPKVSREKIARLYKLDSAGIYDEGLLEDVACSLFARCESILTVTRACMEDVLTCPRCGKDIALSDDAFSCPCGFFATKAQFRTSYKEKQLFGANALPVFKRFAQDYPRCRDYGEKMIAVDTLIHAFHILHSARNGYNEEDIENGAALGRPTAANLIEGSLTQVVSFLDELSASSDTWREVMRRANGSFALESDDGDVK